MKIFPDIFFNFGPAAAEASLRTPKCCLKPNKKNNSEIYYFKNSRKIDEIKLPRNRWIENHLMERDLQLNSQAPARNNNPQAPVLPCSAISVKTYSKSS